MAFYGTIPIQDGWFRAPPHLRKPPQPPMRPEIPFPRTTMNSLTGEVLAYGCLRPLYISWYINLIYVSYNTINYATMQGRECRLTLPGAKLWRKIMSRPVHNRPMWGWHLSVKGWVEPLVQLFNCFKGMRIPKSMVETGSFLVFPQKPTRYQQDVWVNLGLVEGSSEVKLPTICRDGKAEVGSLKKWEDKRWRKSEERRCTCAKR